MRTRLIQIGNSRGIRLPKPLIDEVGLSDEVELSIREGAIVISPVRVPRAGWSEAARTLQKRGEHGLLDAPTPTRFDQEEWEW